MFQKEVISSYCFDSTFNSKEYLTVSFEGEKGLEPLLFNKTVRHRIGPWKFVLSLTKSFLTDGLLGTDLFIGQPTARTYSRLTFISENALKIGFPEESLSL